MTSCWSFRNPYGSTLRQPGAELGRALAALDRDDARAAWAWPGPAQHRRPGPASGAQAGWLEPFRNELEDIRLQALEVVGRSRAPAGRRPAGLGGTRGPWPDPRQPYRESGYTLLMQAHALRGNSAEAVRVFDRLRVLLREELGTAPSQGAIAVHEQLLRGRAVPPPRGRPPPRRRRWSSRPSCGPAARGRSSAGPGAGRADAAVGAGSGRGDGRTAPRRPLPRVGSAGRRRRHRQDESGLRAGPAGPRRWRGRAGRPGARGGAGSVSAPAGGAQPLLRHGHPGRHPIGRP